MRWCASERAIITGFVTRIIVSVIYRCAGITANIARCVASGVVIVTSFVFLDTANRTLIIVTFAIICKFCVVDVYVFKLLKSICSIGCAIFAVNACIGIFGGYIARNCFNCTVYIYFRCI